jgi:uncharacterized protein (DUF433 family)
MAKKEIIMEIQNVINVDPDILNGKPVFTGTRVPVESLFDHLEAGVSLDEFLDDFPSVKKQQAIDLLDIASKLMSSKDITKLYEAVA